MFLRHALIWIGFASLLGAAAPAHADDPSAMDPGREWGKYLSAHGYGVVPCESEYPNRTVVDVVVNGRRLKMFIDTGSALTYVNHSVAEEMGLEIHETPFPFIGVGGISHGHIGEAQINSFKIDGYEINRTSIIHVPPKSDVVPHDGVLGYDYLQLNAVLLPVGARFFLFKPGATPVPSIDAYMAAMHFVPISVTPTKNGFRIPGTLNGHPFSGIVDCGAENTIFDGHFVFKVAGQPAPNVGSLFMTPGYSLMFGEGADGKKLPEVPFVPAGLTLGAFKLTPTPLMAMGRSTLAAQKLQALVGFDLLAAHRAILDFGHDVLWMK